MPRSGRSTSWDGLLPAGIFVLAAFEMLLLRPPGWGYGIAIELLSCVLLVRRRAHPLVCATLSASVLLLMPWFGPQLSDASVPIMILAVSIFALARWRPDLRGLFGVGVIVLLLFTDYAAVDARHHDLSDVLFVAALIAPPFVLGRVTRKLADQKLLLEEREELVKREAVRDERDRIAREMHDVIAHSVSVMVVQTAAAQDLVRTDPDRVEQMLTAVTDTGRRALAETGRLLHVLRDQADELSLGPAPGLVDLPDLVEKFRANGLEVDLKMREPLPALPTDVDVSAYRIVQEALTNALRYGADRTAQLHLAGTPTSLSIRATNPSGNRGSTGSGLGLLGMAERVSLLGGTLTHGVADGSFELAATLPVVQA